MKYECDSCGYTADEQKFPEARKLFMRLTPGGKYTDRECPDPDCGSLAFPITELHGVTHNNQSGRKKGKRK